MRKTGQVLLEIFGWAVAFLPQDLWIYDIGSFSQFDTCPTKLDLNKEITLSKG